jgi:hypothetical protein
MRSAASIRAASRRRRASRALEVSTAEFLLEFLVVTLDAPAQLGEIIAAIGRGDQVLDSLH